LRLFVDGNPVSEKGKLILIIGLCPYVNKHHKKGKQEGQPNRWLQKKKA
jgi:hypothetical protein